VGLARAGRRAGVVLLRLRADAAGDRVRVAVVGPAQRQVRAARWIAGHVRRDASDARRHQPRSRDRHRRRQSRRRHRTGARPSAHLSTNRNNMDDVARSCVPTCGLTFYSRNEEVITWLLSRV